MSCYQDLSHCGSWKPPRAASLIINFPWLSVRSILDDVSIPLIFLENSWFYFIKIIFRAWVFYFLLQFVSIFAPFQGKIIFNCLFLLTVFLLSLTVPCIYIKDLHLVFFGFIGCIYQPRHYYFLWYRVYFGASCWDCSFLVIY